MTTLFLGNNLRSMQQRLEAVDGTIRFLYLGNSQMSREIRSYLHTRPNTHELPLSVLIQRKSNSFRESYIDFIGTLNRNNGSLHWWSMTFPDKNPSADDLPRMAMYYSLVTALVNESESPLVVVTDESVLVTQLRDWSKQNGIDVQTSYRSNDTLKFMLKSWTPVAVISASMKTLVYWLMSRKMRPRTSSVGVDIAIITPTHPRCFDSDGRFHDVYFSPLIERLERSNIKAMSLPLVHEKPFRQFLKLRKTSASLPLAPLEAFFSLGSIFACTLASLKAFYWPVQVKGPIEMDGLNMTHLVKTAIRKECHSGSFFMTLRAFYSGRNFGRIVRPSRCIYPFGNLAWEKAFIMGVRAQSDFTKFAAFIHASITPRHMNLYFSKCEARETPLPEEIITTGEVVEELLEKQGNYPEGIFKAACALRQGNKENTDPKPPSKRIKTILVALATSTDEYIKILSFLDQTGLGPDHYEILVRPHPIISMDEALSSVKLSRSDFYSVDTGTLAEAFEKSDVVLYASSTVGMEAISRGIPAIYIYLGNVLNSDPMSSWDKLKWSVDDPQQLEPTIESINSIPEQEFRERQCQGQAYINGYLRPVTDETLRPFWGDTEP